MRRNKFLEFLKTVGSYIVIGFIYLGLGLFYTIVGIPCFLAAVILSVIYMPYNLIRSICHLTKQIFDEVDWEIKYEKK